MFVDYLNKLCGTTSRSGSDLDMVSFWTLCLVIATFLLYLVAKYQLTGINKTTKADFIKRFNGEFFVESVRNIVMLLDVGALRYCVASIEADGIRQAYPYFEIVVEVVNQLKISDDIKNELLKKKIYTAYELDDLLLGRFEDIGLFEKQGLLNTQDVYNHFHWYIDVAWNNTQIIKYIEAQREEYGDGIYNHFEYIYKKCSKINMRLRIKRTLCQRLKIWQ